ncbi:MAG TPA: IS66 family transposase [Pseudonocardiaceae bacterium]
MAELAEQVAVLSRMLFGQSSEKSRPGPGPGGDWPGGDAGQVGGLPDPAGSGVAKPGRGQQRGSRGHGRRDYSHLETEEVVHDVADGLRCCADCGLEFEFLCAETSDQVDWRVKLIRIVHRRLRYRRRCDCAGTRTVTAPPAPNPVPKGLFTAGFLARLLYHKYVLGMPVHRIVRMLAAEGLQVSEGTLTGALQNIAALLEPLRTVIVARNAAAVHVHADETTWRVYERPDGKDGYRWWLWVFLADDTVVFTMDPTRSASVLDTHFGIDRGEQKLSEGRRLVLSTDFYVAYQSLGRVEGVDPLWCWAHIRRYFIRAGDAHVQLRYWRDQWIGRIADLYTAHRAMAAAQAGTAEHTQASTDFDAALQVMDTARQQQQALYSLHPAAKKVLATLDREWDGLIRHRDFPDISLDNNPAERALRNPVIGRKNYYGSHAQWAAYLAATVWTITATAERNNREPLTYLTDYLQACALAGGKPPEGEALQRFLPWLPGPGDTTGSRDNDPPPAPPEPTDPGHTP